MAKVPLRTYSRDIENLVDRGQLDEAIAHCRHILNTFPKYLETYRLLGKSYLEARRYEEATDIFERVLMAVPDDFVAHVGKSIIQDEQKNMDAAIWHMERAFEVQPSNAAIQAELQRLYGRRDGVEPPKIRLTRGALAHMYVQGELYPQAISEIKSVLEEDSGRKDMQVLLAQAYFRAGQKGEAAEVCSRLLRLYPYCLDANRVLVELLPETEQGESVQVYRQRVNELDPYAAFATRSVFHTDEVSDSVVSLERLEWDGEPVLVRSDWGESAGIGRDEGASPRDEEPAWLRSGLMDETPAASGSTEEPAPVSSDDDIPDFLRDAGWGESTGAFQEVPGVFDESDKILAESGIEQGDLPDWVKALAPSGADAENAAPQMEGDEGLAGEDIPDWLQGLGVAQSAPPAEQPLVDEGVPDWLESMKPTEEAAPGSEEQIAPALEGDEGLPEWLESMQTGEPAAVQDASTEGMADWQFEEEAPASPVEAGAIETGSLGVSAEEQDDAISWLESLAAKHGARPEELVTKPEDRKETEPEWVREAREVAEAGPPVAAEEPEEPLEMVEESAAPVGMPDFLAEEEQVEPSGEPAVAFDARDTGELGTSTDEQDDAIAWLEGLAAKHGAKPEELVTKPEDRRESEPEWVQRAKEAGVAEPVAEEQPQQPVAEEPVSPAEIDETGMWLRGLEEGEGEFIEEQEAAGEAEPLVTEEAAPDWLHEIEEGVSEAEVAQTSGEEAQVPGWLRGMEVGPSEAEIPAFSMEEAAVPEPSQEVVGKVDINTASFEQLAELPGIGDLLAQNIVAHRETYGGFSSVDDLGNIVGIDPATIDELRDRVEFSQIEAEIATDEAKLSDWLQSLDAQASEAESVKAPAETVPSEDLPFWLADLAEETEQKPAPTAPSDDLPDWLRAEAEEEPGQPQPVTPADWQPAEAAEPAQAEEPFARMAAAETPTEPPAQVPAQAPVAPEPVAEMPIPAPFEPEPKLRAEPKPQPPAPPEREPYREPVTRSRSGMTGMLSAVQDPNLSRAQNELTRGNIPGAMESYGKLIKKGKLLDEIIFDLREAMYRYPVEVTILQTLGDAYLRANRLQDALDAYTKAEELLR